MIELALIVAFGIMEVYVPGTCWLAILSIRGVDIKQEVDQ